MKDKDKIDAATSELEKNPFRRPVVALTAGSAGTVVVMCSDGSVWGFDASRGDWRDFKRPLPGSLADQLSD